MSKKIYLSGKITGIEVEAIDIFENAEILLSTMGYKVVNPMKLNHNHDKDWHSYMKVDIKELCDCDEIYMLQNWTDSKGAIIEHTIALWLGLKIIYEPKPEDATVMIFVTLDGTFEVVECWRTKYKGYSHGERAMADGFASYEKASEFCFKRNLKVIKQ